MSPCRPSASSICLHDHSTICRHQYSSIFIPPLPLDPTPAAIHYFSLCLTHLRPSSVVRCYSFFLLKRSLWTGISRAKKLVSKRVYLMCALNTLTPNDDQSEALFLQWLCLCLGKMWENFTEAQFVGLQPGFVVTSASLLSEPQPENMIEE